MKAESVVLGIGGVVFGLLVGWIVGDQQGRRAERATAALTAPAPAATAAANTDARQPPPLDDTKVQALTAVAEKDAKNVDARVQLANMYFDSERFQDAIKWYEDALRLDPRNVEVSTDLGVSYYYSNDPDRALKQFDHSLGLDRNHTKTLLNQGIVLAFGKRDLDGAAQSWQKVVALAPDSPEAQVARRALESLKAAHPEGAAAPSTGS